MKYLALIFLFGLSSAAFVHDDLDDHHDDLLDDYYEDLIVSQKTFKSFAEAEQDMKTELGKQLKKTLHSILDKIKDTLEHGKSVSRELIDQARDLLVRLRDNGIELEDRTKSLLEDVKDRFKSWWREILDKLNVKKDKQVLFNEFRAEQDMKTELGKRLKKTLHHILDEIKNTLERGKSVGRELIDQARDLLVRLRDNGIELEDRTKSLLEDVKDRLKSWWREILDKLNVKKDKQEVQHSDLFHRIIERLGLEKHLQTLQEMVTGNSDRESIEAFIREKFPRSKKLMDFFLRLFNESREKFQNFLDKLINKFRKNE
nr:hypothetical protein F6W77_19335 [Acinetobacter baumannii]